MIFKPPVYLACPYSHWDEDVIRDRYQFVTKAAADITCKGIHVFSPITHSHLLAEMGSPTDWDFWAPFDLHMLDSCSELYVLLLDGWRDSVGVQAEIAHARKTNKKVRYIDPNSLYEVMVRGSGTGAE